MIAYYVHHHGRGHVVRALAIAEKLGEELVFLSSLLAPARLRPTDRWVELPLDVDGSAPDGGARDATANGRLHWAPLGVDGLAARSARVLETLTALAPRRVVVDCSVEITLLCRLAGFPVTVVAQPGHRDDAVHQLGYGVADQILAPWSDRVYAPDWLAGHADRTHYVGAISRFDGRVPVADGAAGGVLLAGAGGCDLPADAVDQLRSAAPELDWKALGGASPWVEDVWSSLSGADLVVTHAGQGALADVALSGARAVVIPQDRPFGEQRVTADALAVAEVAVTAPTWPSMSEWPTLLSRALALDRRRWELMNVRGAAARAAVVLAA